LRHLFGSARRYPAGFRDARGFSTLGPLRELGPSRFGSAASVPHVGQIGCIAVLALLLGAVAVKSRRV
jgi:hypothetical protein